MNFFKRSQGGITRVMGCQGLPPLTRPEVRCDKITGPDPRYVQLGTTRHPEQMQTNLPLLNRGRAESMRPRAPPAGTYRTALDAAKVALPLIRPLQPTRPQQPQWRPTRGTGYKMPQLRHPAVREPVPQNVFKSFINYVPPPGPSLQHLVTPKDQLAPPKRVCLPDIYHSSRPSQRPLDMSSRRRTQY